ncbi:MAG: DUF1080 domain-containing protein [Chitinophagales bacterium]|nr:DUF1080 domain-containing protein [Chitinophagales bacterium]
MMRILKYTFFILLIFIFEHCSKEAATAKRPIENWVFRSVLDWNPRMITLALSDQVWAAYHTSTGGLYKVWKGSVYFDGAVYTKAHGPQPISLGNSYFENEYTNPWFLLHGTDTIAVDYRYLGHRFVKERVQLMYQLTSPSLPAPIRIFEAADASMKGGNPVFERNFSTENIPDGYQLGLKFNFNSIKNEDAIQTDGQLTLTNKEEVQYDDVKSLKVNGYLWLKNQAWTKLNLQLLETPVIENKNIAGEASEEDKEEDHSEGLKLIAKSDCKACHNKTRQTIGPAYVAIAQKYAKTPENVSLLVSKIKQGGSGIWGSQTMTPHLDLKDEVLQEMVQYILSLDESKNNEAPQQGTSLITMDPDTEILEEDLLPGSVVKIYPIPANTKTLPTFSKTVHPKEAGILSNFDNLSGNDFKGWNENFALQAEGYLKIEEAGTYTFHLWSDDGSKLAINGQQVIDNDGLHGAEYKDASIAMKKGYYRFDMGFFQAGGGQFLSLNWKKPGDTDFEVIPALYFYHKNDVKELLKNYKLPMADATKVPGDQYPLLDVHPSFDLFQARPDDFKPMVGGLDFMSDGSMIVSTWDAVGGIYKVTNVQSGDPDKMSYKRIAFGLAEPLGLKVVNDTIYVMQKQEITRLIDTDGDEIIDEYQALCYDWKVSSNFHEFGFGLAYKDGYFYATLATAIVPGGASVNPQIPDRGKVIKVNKNTGELTFVASGLRTPNGVGIGYQGEVFVADNQGDWLPSSKIVHVRDGAWFGSRSVDPEGTKDKKEDLPLVWLPQDEIGNSPSTPLAIDLGPYKGQMIHGEVTHGGVKRVFVEEVNGQLQGAVFRFIQGLEAGVNRLAWGPNQELYIGGIGNPGNWGQSGKQYYGLQRLVFNQRSTFEMLAVRAKSNGMEIEFTEPLEPGDGWNLADYEVKQWYYLPTENYGGPKMNEQTLPIKSASVSEDRTKVFLQIDGLKDNHVVYIHLKKRFVSELYHELWSSESWYTLNQIPKDKPGSILKNPYSNALNTLNDAEIKAGWQLLFNGKNLSGWRNYKKQTIGSGWIVQDGAIHLNAVPSKDGNWQVDDGGDIITDKSYENYEFRCEWKIGNCGNSGIIFNVVEDDKYNYVWETGPEMQVLDNSCHPDARYVTHKAGDLYDMIACKYPVVKPAGAWNEVRIVNNRGKVDFWLNGTQVVSFMMHDDTWKDMIARSKFKEMSGFGLAKGGHIALQDHGDKVWYRNIKIKTL